tara:strand:+ start:296 stop:1090 length:795 start_codon:yes stop_codon:yes gene_type:complete
LGQALKQYLDLLTQVLESGEERADRTGTGTLSVFGTQSRYDLRDGFPLLTTKKVLFSAVVRELIWFLKGSTNIHDDLTEHTPIWDAWADESGELGPIYGAQWRSWGGRGFDQIQGAIELLISDPTSRRNLVSAWNVEDLPKMRLQPCHTMFQFYATNNGELDLQLYQRSADLALGVPFNIASYALLLMIVANEVGMTPRCFVHTIGDAHIYKNHVDGVRKQLDRTPGELPRVEISNKLMNDLVFEDITLHDYEHAPFIKFEVSV